MATRRPLVVIGGELQELPVGDLVAGAASGSVSVSTDPGNAIVLGTDTNVFAPKPLYVQAAAPTIPPGTPAIWVQTGLGPLAEDMTIWIEDGL